MTAPFNAQTLFGVDKTYLTVKSQCKDALRKTYIRPLNDATDTTHVLRDKYQQRMLRKLLIARENQFRRSQPSKKDIISVEKINELVHRFHFYNYVQQSRFFIAGGFLLRMLEEPDRDIGEIAEKHDIDVFYRDEQHVHDWITTLRANHVVVEQLAEKEHENNSFRVTAPSEARPFIVQFTKTNASGIYELLESFDFPICQIGVDLSRRCFTTLGFDVAWEHKDDAVTYINNNAPSHLKSDYDARIAKYEARGYRFKIVKKRVYYGYRKFAYNEWINERDIAEWGKIDAFFASQAWCGGETWADRVRRHEAEEKNTAEKSKPSK